MKVTETSVPVDTELRRLAVTAIAIGRTPEALRRESAGMPAGVGCKLLADEIEELTARGVTGRVASRVLRERDRRHPAGGTLSGHGARHVAAIYLAEFGPDELRASTELRGTPAQQRMFAMIADAMDELLAEGSGAAGIAQALHAGDGRPASTPDGPAATEEEG